MRAGRSRLAQGRARRLLRLGAGLFLGAGQGGGAGGLVGGVRHDQAGIDEQPERHHDQKDEDEQRRDQHHLHRGRTPLPIASPAAQLPDHDWPPPGAVIRSVGPEAVPANPPPRRGGAGSRAYVRAVWSSWATPSWSRSTVTEGDPGAPGPGALLVRPRSLGGLGGRPCGKAFLKVVGVSVGNGKSSILRAVFGGIPARNLRCRGAHREGARRRSVESSAFRVWKETQFRGEQLSPEHPWRMRQGLDLSPSLGGHSACTGRRAGVTWRRRSGLR